MAHTNTSPIRVTHLSILITHVVGARPNFPKLAPVHHALGKRGVRQEIIHTGQHYDDMMSEGFFRLLDLPTPTVNLEVGSGTHAVQTGKIMERIEPELVRRPPDWLVVYGDVNSTAAATLVAVKLGVRVAHVEAGLRSFDRTMPEEINRLVTDRLSDLLLTPSRDADRQLIAEGEPADKIVFCGNVMIDTLMRVLPFTNPAETRRRYAVPEGSTVVTLHRPSNVDDLDRLRRICVSLAQLSSERPVFFAAHPRTRKAIAEQGLDIGETIMHDAIPYLDMLALVQGASLVITDSGGLQEETTVLGVPCLTVRYSTERPVTVSEGTNRLVPEPEDLVAIARDSIRAGEPPQIEGWDGKAGERVADTLIARAANQSKNAAA